MDLLEAHGRLVQAQEAAGPVDPESAFDPLIETAAADLSGQLEDAADDDDLREAVRYGLSLFDMGVCSEADLHQAMSRVVMQSTS